METKTTEPCPTCAPSQKAGLMRCRDCGTTFPPSPSVVTPRTLLDQIAEHLSTLGDEASQILEMRIAVLLGKRGLGALLTEPTPKPPVVRWAAYSGSAAGGDGISLHKTEWDALEQVATDLGIDDTVEVIAAISALDADALRDAIQEHCDSGASDWAIQEVTID